jgi:hypothetical protein
MTGVGSRSHNLEITDISYSLQNESCLATSYAGDRMSPKEIPCVKASNSRPRTAYSCAAGDGEAKLIAWATAQELRAANFLLRFRSLAARS